MSGLTMMLKALGVNVTPENIATIEGLIPQIPAKLNQAAAFVNNAVANFDARLQALETRIKTLEGGQVLVLEQLLEIKEKVNHGDTSGNSGKSTGPGTNTTRNTGKRGAN